MNPLANLYIELLVNEFKELCEQSPLIKGIAAYAVMQKKKEKENKK